MTAHGFAYHWPLVPKVVLAVTAFVVVVPLYIAVGNWFFRDLRRPTFGLALLAVYFSIALVGGEHTWVLVIDVIGTTFGAAAFASRWLREGPKPDDPLQMHPFRWLYRKARPR